ncbi:hypothetical protein [Nocardia sp. NRRL S-836]|uniref:hypothetical protein n=1 Tax=Nocardia sp. NRRL S-836 TaxID=1519492 RepID=UPI0006ADB3FD|nr:hypothetical protein [Nocardia sp. NRRL S-836]KOV90008.1 hypothetical protein ADL03_01105 [Nocardia sp. NRRL S-836]
MVTLCQANPSLPASDGRVVDVRAACSVLQAWSGTGGTGERSRGALLWRAFVERSRRPGTVL